MTADNREEKSLFRFQYVEEDETYVDWVWLTIEELVDYKSNHGKDIHVRPATPDETDLYEEAYADGYGVAALMEFESQYDGVTYRLELPEGCNSIEFSQKKMFECAICGKHKDFDTEVATANGLYLGEVKENKLWHVCFDCATLQVQLDTIQIDYTEEGDSDEYSGDSTV